MSWLDKISIEQILRLRDKFNVTTFIETGTYKGVNAKFHAQNFKEVLTCDISDEYLKIARERLKEKNVKIFKQSSPNFLSSFIEEYHRQNRKDTVFIYLDAHFYDPLLPPHEKWVVINELKALKNFKNCIICIHDFDYEGLGHCRYDGESLDWPLVGKYVKEINPNFYFYTNTKGLCEIYNEKTISKVKGIILDEVTLDNIRYAHSSEEKTYRGILYCVPQELNLNEFKLKRLEV